MDSAEPDPIYSALQVQEEQLALVRQELHEATRRSDFNCALLSAQLNDQISQLQVVATPSEAVSGAAAARAAVDRQTTPGEASTFLIPVR